jgi:lipopolysaccharide transport system permease protein
VAGLEAPGEVPYFLFSYVGLLGWNLFSSLAGRSSSTLVGSAQLIQKVYFPRLLIPLSKFSSTLIDFAVGATLLVGLLLWFWSLPGLAGLAVAVGCAVLFLMFALGLGLTAGAISVHYRDVQYLIPVVLQFLLYASPVAYAVESVPERYLFFYQLNPLSGLLETFRWGVLGVGEFQPTLLLYSTGFTVVVFLAGTLFFKRLEASFADAI